MSLPDDFSGFAGPVPDVRLFGQPLHGKVVRPYQGSLEEAYIELHLPNGEVMREVAWAWTNLSQNVSFIGYQGRSAQFTEYGFGGTNYYWKRPGIGPVPVRTPEQQAQDAALGHQWRNDRINARWIWCDDAGDRWAVSINPSGGGSGLTKNFVIMLQLAGALNEPGITRSMTVAISDPADEALPADFHQRADNVWALELQDVHPAGGARALFGIVRQPVDWSAPNAVEDYAFFELFDMSADQHDNVLKLPAFAGSTFYERRYPYSVYTAHIELTLSGAARSGAWSATPTPVLTRSQTSGTWSVSPPLPPIASGIDVSDVWARHVTTLPPAGNSPEPYRETFSGIGGELPAGTPKPADVPDTMWSNRRTFHRGDGACSMSGSGMVVGVFYDTAGDVAVVSTDIDYAYSYAFDATFDQSGTMVGYVQAQDDIFTVEAETRSSSRTYDQNITSSVIFRIRVNGLVVHTVSCEHQQHEGGTVSSSYNAQYQGQAGSGVSLVHLRTQSGGLARQFFADTDGLTTSATYTSNDGLQTLIGAGFYSTEPRFSWRARFGFGSIAGVNPLAEYFSGGPLGDYRSARAGWSYSLVRCTNNCFQLRASGRRSGPVVVVSARIGPVICPAGAVGGVLNIPDTRNQLPPLCVSYNPFTQEVVQDYVLTTFI